jgi:hypothetical protein
MSKGRPFFVLNDDRGNPINAATDLAIAQGAASGKTRGDSRSIDPMLGRKYPRGFTPPVDYYTDQNPIEAAKLQEFYSQVGGTNVNTPYFSNDLGNILATVLPGTDPKTGRPIEYGTSITVDTTQGIKVKLSGSKYVTELNQPLSPFSNNTPSIGVPKLENLSPGNRYVNPDNINPETNLPMEYGNKLKVGSGVDSRVAINQEDRLGLLLAQPAINPDQERGTRYRTYNFFNDYKSKQFIHLLDFFINSSGDSIIPKVKSYGIINDKMSEMGPMKESPNPKPWLGGQFFYKTFEDNEDPTILGVDIKFKRGGSPLFNGNLERFLDVFGKGYKELETRKDIYKKFIQQVLKFIEIDEKSLYKGTTQKAYYLQNIKGLDKLVERDGGSDAGYFVDFGKDLITLEFLEDVSQNMGYLSALYKTLAYSRINGKQMIPKNLLKFDCDITITEIRNYQRSILTPGNKEKVLIFADKISRYTYSLYECNFIFDKMPHGEAVSNAKTELLENFALTFDYKFSTLNFTKYTGNFALDDAGDGLIKYYSIDNKQTDLMKSLSGDLISEKGLEYTDDKKTDYKDRFSYLNQIAAWQPSVESVTFNPDDFPPDPNETVEENVARAEDDRINAEGNQSVLDDAKSADKQKSSDDKSEPKTSKLRERLKLAGERAFDQIKTGLKRAAINEVNRQIFTQAALLNRTIENIRNSVPYAGRMSEPTNVYTGTNAFRNDAINTLRNAVGGAVKGFFSKP